MCVLLSSHSHKLKISLRYRQEYIIDILNKIFQWTQIKFIVSDKIKSEDYLRKATLFKRDILAKLTFHFKLLK